MKWNLPQSHTWEIILVFNLWIIFFFNTKERRVQVYFNPKTIFFVDEKEKEISRDFGPRTGGIKFRRKSRSSSLSTFIFSIRLPKAVQSLYVSKKLVEIWRFFKFFHWIALPRCPCCDARRMWRNSLPNNYLFLSRQDEFPRSRGN